MSTKNVVVFLITAFSISLIMSCKSKERITRAKKEDLPTVLQNMHEQKHEYQRLNARAKLLVDGEESRLGGKTNIRIISDSLVWMNFKKLSIEASRVLIRPDSMWIVYRLDRAFERGSFREFADYYKVPFGFESLQSFILGEMPIPEIGEVISFDRNRSYVIRFQRDGIQYEYKIDGDYQVRQFVMVDKMNRKIMGTQSDYDPEDQFPRERKLLIYEENKEPTQVSLRFNHVEFNTLKSIKFDIPSHYYEY